MSFFDARAARVLVTILLFGLALAFIYLAWRTLVVFLFAILFAYLLEPVVSSMQKRLRLGRGQAVAALYVLIVIGLGALVITMGPSIVRQAAHLSDIAPSLSQRVASGQIAHEVGSQRGWSYQTQLRIQQFLADHRQMIANWVQSLFRDLAGLASNAIWVALIPILAIFFLLSGGKYSDALLEQLARRRQRAFAALLFQDVHDVLANYIRANIILTALGTAIYLAGFMLMRLPYAVALGVGAGLLEFIPVVGPLIGFVIVVITAFLVGYHHLWVLILFMGAQRVLQDYVNAPHIMGNEVQLNPLAVLFGVLAGAELAGIIGVYLSIPVMATLRVIWVRWREYDSSQAVVTPSVEPPTAGPIPPT